MKLARLAGLVLAVLVAAGCSSTASTPPPAIFPSSSPAVFTPAPVVTTPAATRHATAPATHAAMHPATHRPRPGTLIAIADEGMVTYSVMLHPGQCHARDGGRLPDPACTPGSVDPAVTQATIGRTICMHGWTATVRPPSSQTTRAKFDVAEPAYGTTAHGELDHFIPLELGGSNDITNLWLEEGRIPNGKDPVENRLRQAVCSGQITLAAARHAIAHNWTTAEQVLGLGTPAPPPASVAPVAAVPASHSASAASSCYPKTSGGNCYRAGEFCRKSDLGTSGVAGNGERIRCEASGSRNRWEPA